MGYVPGSPSHSALAHLSHMFEVCLFLVLLLPCKRKTNSVALLALPKMPIKLQLDFLNVVAKKRSPARERDAQ